MSTSIVYDTSADVLELTIEDRFSDQHLDNAFGRIDANMRYFTFARVLVRVLVSDKELRTVCRFMVGLSLRSFGRIAVLIDQTSDRTLGELLRKNFHLENRPQLFNSEAEAKFWLNASSVDSADLCEAVGIEWSLPKEMGLS